jgi:phenylalanyl-tRNA synthetase beta chain
MKVLLSWLREFAPIAAPVERIGRDLSMLGMAVEDEVLLGRGLDGIVVAGVLELRQHPDAKKIQRVVVDAGGADPIEVWCGAFNMAVGDLVPLATVGTVMPDGMEIGRRKILGEYSNGMLCSPRELQLSDDGGGIVILDPDGAPPGTPIRDALGIVEDVLWDLEINPNRPDAMSVAGVARDLAAKYDEPFAMPSPSVVRGGAPASSVASVEILDPDLCGRFTAAVLRGVQLGPSPAAIARRLTLLGMRPINNVVDVSNYVMLELNQPNHAYDLAALPGGAIRVRRAREGETLVTLDDLERHFHSSDLLICDGNDRAIGIAGVMGGADTEISESTTDVLLEMAWFNSIAIARTSRRLGLRSEASARFEKGTDPEVIDLAVDRFTELLGSGVLAPDTVDARGELPVGPRVRLRTSKVNGVLGTALTPAQVRAELEPIGFAAEVVKDGDGREDHLVSIPSWRPDCAVEIDLVEEVARHYGYDAIGRTVPPAVRFGALSAVQRDRRAVRRALVGLGFSEAMPMAFLAPGDQARAGLGDDGITITNPLVAEESVLRTSLLPGLLKSVAYNLSHRNDDIRLFEIGHVFLRPADAPHHVAGLAGEPHHVAGLAGEPHHVAGLAGERELPDERENLAVAIAGAEAPEAVQVWWALAEHLGVADATLQAAAPAGLHPTRSVDVAVGGEVVGNVGEVDPGVLEAFGIAERVAWLEIDLGRVLTLPRGEGSFVPFSRFPSSDVDLAFEVPDSVPAADVDAAIAGAGEDLVVDVRLFDVYRGAGVAEGNRSLAYRLRFQATDRTLTDAEVGAARQRLIAAVERAVPAKLRG